MNLLPHRNPVRNQPISSNAFPKNSHSRSQKNSNKLLAIETGIKLGVNSVLALVAISSLVKIAAYGQSQRAKLQEIQVEVVEVEGRVHQLQTDFKQNFDPHQAKSVMQEESDRIDPKRRQIRWVSPSSATDKQPLKRRPLANPSLGYPADGQANFGNFKQPPGKDKPQTATPDAAQKTLPLPLD
ncbi:MAG TPA: hypothetical protein V6C57_02365 [Coleofasciculaceae cyanobacterium]